jgi:DNA-binding LytR/AlgR family response regulator
MFKLKVDNDEHKIIKSELNLTETIIYDYVLTNDRELVEEDKINIVFQRNKLSKITRLLDLIVRGEDLFVIGTNEFGQKNVEARNFYYFIVENDDVYGVLHNTRLLVKMKLYEIEELLKEKDFIRVSKYCLVNIGKIDYIKPALNSKLDLLLKNKEHVEVNRGYLKEFKEALKL